MLVYLRSVVRALTRSLVSTIVYIADVPVGGSLFTTIAGPCAVGSPEMALEAALAVQAAGAQCERGIRTFETTYRFTLDIGAVAVLRERTDLPVVVDPSHAAGRRGLVLPLSLAAVAAGADGCSSKCIPIHASRSATPSRRSKRMGSTPTSARCAAWRSPWAGRCSTWSRPRRSRTASDLDS